MTTHSGIAALYRPPLPATVIPPILLSLAYDLNAPGQDYRPLIEFLINRGALAVQRSFWLLHWDGNVEQFRDFLMRITDGNDSIWVQQVTGPVAGYESNPQLRAAIQRMLDVAHI